MENCLLWLIDGSGHPFVGVAVGGLCGGKKKLEEDILFGRKCAENPYDSRRIRCCFGHLKELAEFTPRMRASMRDLPPKGITGEGMTKPHLEHSMCTS